MSRIDKALRRASAPSGAPISEWDRSDVFVSAWDQPAEREPRRPDGQEGAVRSSEPILTQATRQELPSLSTRWRERLTASSDCNPALLERFRRLAATLHNAQAASGIRSLLVTSANPNEGKTLTALNLAYVLSESYGRRVLLIDADLRRPSISEVVDVTGSVGLSAALKATGDEKLAVIPLSPTLTLLPAGPPDPDPLSGLTSARMKRILEEAASQFDWVILDGPPVGPIADASLLTRMVQGTLLVVKAAVTPHHQVIQAIERIGREQILGVVLNDVEPSAVEKYPSYYGQGRKPERAG